MSQWQILDTGEHSAEENMRLDAELLERQTHSQALSSTFTSGQGTVRPMGISPILQTF